MYKLCLSLACVFSLYGFSAFAASDNAQTGKAVHALNRLAFGPRPGDLEKLRTQGVAAYLREQLEPASIPEPPALKNLLDELKSLQENPMQLAQEFRQARKQRRAQKLQKDSEQVAQAAQEKSQEKSEEKAMPQMRRFKGLVRDAAEARLIRALYSPRQLQEVLVDFWFNHFNVFSGKGLDKVWIADYENRAIRPHVLGRFRDLLGATAHHPAMLFYLDNWQNTAPNSPGARGRFKGLNENYARELMELHTLGVEGGYTQTDVVNLARILTGWGIAGARAMEMGNTSGFRFDPKRHDASDKTFLGKTVRAGGEAEVEAALDMLARHPATARHISFKLAQYFVADDPPKPLVDRMSKEFTKTDGDIRAVLRLLFDSEEFWNTKYRNAKFKSPYRYAVSAVRATGAPIDNFKILLGFFQKAGMPLYGCVTPDGYKNTEAAWLNQSAMEQRLNFATALGNGNLPLSEGSNAINARGKIPVAQPSVPRRAIDADALTRTLGDTFSASTRKALAETPPGQRAALILGAPEFMRY
jgi:uncharacterized protein (DUF1800 family)